MFSYLTTNISLSKRTKIMAEIQANNYLIEDLVLENRTCSIHFSICQSCFWSATILKMGEDSVCPACAGSNLSFIPLSTNESSRLSVSTKSWLEASFSSSKNNSARHLHIGLDKDTINRNNGLIGPTLGT
jgi:hypothetical protein